MIRIAVCDDEVAQLKSIEKYIAEFSAELGMDMQLDGYESGLDLVACLESKKYDLFVLDINMPNVDGYTVARAIREKNIEDFIIFLTNNEGYVFESFKLKIFRYVRKHEIKRELYEAISAALKEILKAQKRTITININGVITDLKINDVQYLEVLGRLITAHCKDSSYSFCGKMQELEDKLKDYGFIRTHKSFLVNANYIRSIDKEDVVLLNGHKIFVSRANRSELKKQFLKYRSWSNDLDD